MTSIKNNPNDTFWLARYAHTTLAPLFAKAAAVEPTLTFHIELTFADVESVHRGNHVSVHSHWARDGMFQYSPWLRTKADVDLLAAKVADDVAALSPLVPA
jgi:hypothetical protein